MKAHEFRNLSRAELITRVEDLQGQYFAVVEGVRTGKEKNHATLHRLRRDIARAKTILQEAPGA